MATAPQLISEDEYLRTACRPDCDYVDGLVLERNWGQYEHSTLQMLVLMELQAHAAEWRVRVRPELRLKVRNHKYRVPDVMVLSEDAPRTPVIEVAPLLCIEIVSPCDTLSDLTKRAKDYGELGVPATWILGPETRQAFVYSQDGLHQAPDCETLRCGYITLKPGDPFAQL